MVERVKMLLQVIRGNAIVIQKIDDYDIRVDCGKYITRDFAKRSLVASYIRLK